jgi:hypothetical protein
MKPPDKIRLRTRDDPLGHPGRQLRVQPANVLLHDACAEYGMTAARNELKGARRFNTTSEDTAGTKV